MKPKFPSSKAFGLRLLSAATVMLSLLNSGDSTLYASITTLSTSLATGSTDRQSRTNFIGSLDGVLPQTIGSSNVNFNSVPSGELFQVGDIVGRNVDATTGGRIWVFTLALPSDAAAGTGFENVFFSGHAFESANNNLEAEDELTWDLVVNGIVVDSATSGAGVDFETLDFTMSNAGGPLATDVQVIMTANGFNSGNEWFATRGTLSATYTVIPESGSIPGVALCSFLVGRRKKRSQRTTTEHTLDS